MQTSLTQCHDCYPSQTSDDSNRNKAGYVSLSAFRYRGSQNHTFWAISTTRSWTNGAHIRCPSANRLVQGGTTCQCPIPKLRQKERMATALGLWENDVGWAKTFRIPVQWTSHVDIWPASHASIHLHATKYHYRSVAVVHIHCWSLWDAGDITEEATGHATENAST